MAGSPKRRKANNDGKGKKISPYFNFCNLNREKVKQSNSKTPVNKALSHLWKSLTEEQKAAYNNPDAPPSTPADLPVEDNEEGEDNSDVDVDNSNDGVNNSSAPPFPLARVRRIIKLDRDIGKLNREVVMAVTSVTQSFLELLGEAAVRVAVEKKHKTIRLDHIVTAVSRQRRMADFLEDSIAHIGKEGSDVDDEEEGDPPPKPSKKPARTPPPPPPWTRSITDFFASKGVPASES